MKITFVCLGNICRSPMGEFIAKDIIKNNSINNVIVDSCGTSNYHEGEDMHIGTKKILNKYGIECSGFTSKPITQQIFDSSNYILVMDDNNYKDVINRFGKNNKVIKITDYCSLNYHYVPDPWYTNDFEETYLILSNSIDNFFKHILNK